MAVEDKAEERGSKRDAKDNEVMGVVKIGVSGEVRKLAGANGQGKGQVTHKIRQPLMTGLDVGRVRCGREKGRRGGEEEREETTGKGKQIFRLRRCTWFGASQHHACALGYAHNGSHPSTPSQSPVTSHRLSSSVRSP